MKLAVALGALLAAAAPVKADSVADFYKGKTVSIVVGHEVGTGFDVYSRVLIRHMGRYIPGAPNMIVQNMLGASGVTSANWLYNVAPKDGTVMGTFAQTVPLEPLFGNQMARYDAGRLVWIGNMESSVAICGVTKASGVKTFEDMRKREVLMGATGPTGPLVKSALAVKNLLGAQIKVIAGYKGSADVKLAMNRGELQGICGLPWSTVKSFWKQELDAGDFIPIIQISGEKTSEIGAIPHANDFIKSERDRALSGLLFGVQELGRVYAAPPDTPADRIAALRKAFMDTMADKEFLSDAAKTGIDIIPMNGETLTKLWKEFTSAPPELVEEAKKATTP